MSIVAKKILCYTDILEILCKRGIKVHIKQLQNLVWLFLSCTVLSVLETPKCIHNLEE